MFSMVIMVRSLAAKINDSGVGRHDDQIRIEVTKEFWGEFCAREQPGRELWVHMDEKDIMVLT